MDVSRQAWDYTNKVAMRGISFGCTLKWINETMKRDDLTDSEKLHDIERAMRLSEKDLAEFIRGDD